MKLTLRREERRLSKKTINSIYKNGCYVKYGCFTIKWLKSNANNLKIRLLIIVPKKNICQAVNRNYIKRIIRESYKINKPFICNLLPYPTDIILIYNKTTMTKFNKLETELLTIFQLIGKK